jgi:voltage-gated potassium channel
MSRKADERVMDGAKAPGHGVARPRPLRNMLLLDVIQDRGSRSIFLWAAGALLAGMLVYHWLEGWTLLDALYFSVVTLATVGYGDLVPTTLIAKLFTIFYVINGVSILVALLDRLREVRTRRFEQRGTNSQGPET